MAKYFNPAEVVSVKTEICLAPIVKTSANVEFLVRRVARSRRRDRRAI